MTDLNEKTVSIVIPCRNEVQFIGKCLQSIVNCTFPKERLTVVVCDGESQDESVNIIKQFEDSYPFIHLINNTHQTTPYALNLGIKYTQSDVVIILGAHSTIEKDFVERNLEVLFSEEQIGCCGGILTNSYADENSLIIGFAMSQRFGVGNAYFRTGDKEGYVDTVAFGAYKREIFEKVGYFDEQLTRNQDDEFNFRLTKAGYKIYLSKNIQSYYVVRSSYKKLFRQYFQYGYWKVYVNRKHHRITTFRQLIPFCFVLFLSLGLICSFFSKCAAIIYILVLLGYWGLAFGFSGHRQFTKAQRRKVVKSFLILHLSYGLGYAEGIWDFMICRRNPNQKRTTSSR
ncbi:MAG: glycosyltransferase family 2 protein [Bacteroidales bacterium]|nr:glycosyltransferase family 2 protein [Bacteroidales bacterium]